MVVKSYAIREGEGESQGSKTPLAIRIEEANSFPLTLTKGPGYVIVSNRRVNGCKKGRGEAWRPWLSSDLSVFDGRETQMGRVRG